MLNAEELSLSEKICYSTLRIEAAIPPNLTSTGTGFLFCFKVNEQGSIPCLVTNKHVIEGSINTSIVITCTMPDGRHSNEKVLVQTTFLEASSRPEHGSLRTSNTTSVSITLLTREKTILHSP